MKFGYRVFAVQLHQHRYRTAQSFGKAAVVRKDEEGKVISGTHEVDYRAQVVADVLAKIGTRHNFGSAADEESGPADGGGMAIRFTGAEHVDHDVVRFTFDQGPHNRDGTLLVEGAPDIELKNKPTLHPYRAVLYAPAESTRGLIGIEVRGRSCPFEAVVRGLANCSDVHWRLRGLGNLAGETAMLEYLRNAEISKTVFDKWTYDSSGAREVKDLSLAVKPSGEAVRQTLLEWAQDYYGLQKQRREVERDEAAEVAKQPNKPKMTKDQRKAETQRRRAAEIVAKINRKSNAQERSKQAAAEMKEGIFVSRGDHVDIDFDEVAVKTEYDGDGRVITPNMDFGKFTYHLGTRRPADTWFFDEVKGTLASLHPEIVDLPIDE